MSKPRQNEKQNLMFHMDMSDGESSDSSLSGVAQDVTSYAIRQEDAELNNFSLPPAAQDTAEHATHQNAIREYKQTTCDYYVLPWNKSTHTISANSNIGSATLSPYQGNYNPFFILGRRHHSYTTLEQRSPSFIGLFFSLHQDSHTPSPTSYTEHDSRDNSDQSNDQNTKEEKEAEKNSFSNAPKTKEEVIPQNSKSKSELTKALEKSDILEKGVLQDSKSKSGPAEPLEKRLETTPSHNPESQRDLTEPLLDKTSEAKKDSKCCNIL